MQTCMKYKQKSRGNIEQFKVKELSSCFVLNLTIPEENCSIFNWRCSRAAPRISFFEVPTKDDEYSKNWRNKVIAFITRDRVIESNLKRQIKNQPLHTCDQHYMLYVGYSY